MEDALSKSSKFFTIIYLLTIICIVIVRNVIGERRMVFRSGARVVGKGETRDDRRNRRHGTFSSTEYSFY